MLAWLRRIIVSVGIGGFSYALMLGFMVLSVIYDKELEPVINFAFDTGRLITNWLELVGRRHLLGTGRGQSPPRKGEYDPCGAFGSRNHNCRHRRRHSPELASRRKRAQRFNGLLWPL